MLIVDGQGETESVSLGVASPEKITLSRSFPASRSLGYFYEAVCRFLGYGNFDAGKIMGLSSYTARESDFSRSMGYRNGHLSGFPNIPIGVAQVDIEEKVIKWWLKKLEHRTNLPKRQREYIFSSSFRFENDRDKPIPPRYIAVAASAQRTLEKVMIKLVAELKDKYQISRVVLGGGVALNCAANREIAQQLGVQVHVPPSPADSGVAIGAALYVAKQLNQSIKYSQTQSPYLGPKYSGSEIRKLLEHHKVAYRYTSKPEIVAANLLFKNKLVGWFQGRAEFGPRALGNRSILASPRNKDSKSKLNDLKGREQWRPVGVSLPVESVSDFFEEQAISPYMMLTATATQKMKLKCKIAVHIDGTCRPQAVKTANNPLFYNLLRHLGNGKQYLNTLRK